MSKKNRYEYNFDGDVLISIYEYDFITNKEIKRTYYNSDG
ncbi:MAG: DUF2963 domain-containing protein, partial [Candidatus Phytoplasma sp. TWB_XP]